MTSIALAVAALIPAVILCIYIYRKDRADKEPISLLLLLLGAGALACVPASILETILDPLYLSFFSRMYEHSIGIFANLAAANISYQAAENFLNVALVEEGLKFLALFLITRNNRNFNSLFDGVIYATFVSLGFAALENVLYVVSSGYTTAIARAITSVPGHTFFGVFMGMFYTQWHLLRQTGRMEITLLAQHGLPTRLPSFQSKARRQLALALVVPILIHGFYDFSLSVGSTALHLVYCLFMLALYFYCFRTIRRYSRADQYEFSLMLSLILLKYPQLRPALQPEADITPIMAPIRRQ